MMTCSAPQPKPLRQSWPHRSAAASRQSPVRARLRRLGMRPIGSMSSSRCYAEGVRAVEPRYEEGLLKPAKPLTLRPGERVVVTVLRLPDVKR
jgi:hypothetical protein